MSPGAEYVALLGSTPLVVLAIQALVVRATRRWVRPTAQQAVTFFSIFLGMAVVAAVSWARFLNTLGDPSELRWAVAYGLLVYWGLAYAYFHCYNMTETARRFRILGDLSRKGPLSLDALRSHYNPNQLLEVRLHRLVSLGQIELVEGRYRLKGEGVLTIASGLLLALRKPLGFYEEME